MALEAITLKAEIKEAVKKSFIKIVETRPDIYCFALYSDEGCETLAVVSNTIDYFEKSQKENGEDESDFYSKYSPDEWDFDIYWGEEDVGFKHITKQLGENSDIYDFENPEDERKFDEFQQNFYQVCIDVLKELKSEDFFQKSFPKDLFYCLALQNMSLKYQHKKQ